MLKNWLRLLIPILMATLACSLAVDDGTQNGARRPVVGAERPAVVLLAPASGNRYALGTRVMLYAEASDLGAGVARVEFYDNFDEVIATVAASNPNGDPTVTAIVPWTPPSAQRHFIRVQAFRADGTESSREETFIEVVDVAGAPVPQQTEDATSQQGAVQPAQTTQPAQEAATAADAPPAQNATNTTLTATVNVEALNVRVAPDINASIATPAITSGVRIELVGRSADNLWYATPIEGGGVGWVFGQPLQIDGDPSTLPLVAAP